jgi:hypothetical protein
MEYGGRGKEENRKGEYYYDAKTLYLTDILMDRYGHSPFNLPT